MIKNDNKKTDEENQEEKKKTIDEVLEDQTEKKESKESVELKQKVENLEGQVKRVLADYQNLEKRVAEQRRELIMSANKDLLLKILPILDTLVLASKHTTDKSLQVSIKQFLVVLESEGIKRIKTEGEQFNPNTMECLTTAEGEEGKILEEARIGYMIGDKVLRVAQVIVGKGK